MRPTGGDVWGQAVDVADRAAMAAAFDAVAERHGRIDVVFANAGIDAGPGFLSTEGRSQPRRRHRRARRPPLGPGDRGQPHLRLHDGQARRAPHEARPAAAASSSPRRSPRRSTRAIVGTPYMPAKAGVDHFVRQMAMELGAFGILINCISPGPFMTNIAGGRLKNPGRPPGLRGAVPDRQDRRSRGHQGPGALSGLALLVLRDREPDRDRWRVDACASSETTSERRTMPFQSGARNEHN